LVKATYNKSVERDYEMAARGRKQKACLLQWNLGETLETNLAGKTTKKRQNFDPSTPAAGAENLHFTLRNQEGPGAARCPCPDGLGRHGQGELSGTAVLPQTTWARSA
jgi:hypothetical protein